MADKNYILDQQDRDDFLKLVDVATHTPGVVGAGDIPNLSPLPQITVQAVKVQITSNVSGAGGKYNGKIIRDGIKVDQHTATNLASADFGTAASSEDCIVLHCPEIGLATHSIDLSGTVIRPGFIIGYSEYYSGVQPLPIVMVGQVTKDIGHGDAYQVWSTGSNGTDVKWDYVRAHS